MPYADNNGVKIYYEVEGQGPPLILAHGHGNSQSTWRRNGYTKALRNDFRLVLFDARGHGRSDKPHDPDAYADMQDDVVTILDDLGIRQAHYYGFSMGAKIGYHLAVHHAERFQSFILNSHTPYCDEGDTKTREEIMEGLNLLLNDPDAYLRRQEQKSGGPLPPEVRDEFLANDARALIAASTSADRFIPLANHELSQISAPCLVLCGDRDLYHAGAKEAASHIPHATFVSLPGLIHVQSQLRSDVVLPHVRKFLAEVNA